MSRYKIQSTSPSLPSDLEELLRQFDSEAMIYEFAKDLVRGHFQYLWEQASS